MIKAQALFVSMSVFTSTKSNFHPVCVCGSFFVVFFWFLTRSVSPKPNVASSSRSIRASLKLIVAYTAYFKVTTFALTHYKTFVLAGEQRYTAPR